MRVYGVTWRIQGATITMKFYLSSYMLGHHTDRLLAMVAEPRRMIIVTNALDAIPLEAQLKYARETFDPVTYFAEAGFDPAMIDLRRYFGRKGELRDVLLRQNVIWAVGGNSFLLRRAMRASGFDEVLPALLEAGVVYAGWSAGACVAGDSLQAVAPMDEPEPPALGYTDTVPVWEGLGLVPFGIIPHWDSEHREAEAAARAVAQAEANGTSFRALRDGDVLVCDNGRVELLARRD
jgi:dipeptidase E